MREAEAREANVLVVEVGHVRLREVLAIDADVDQHAGRAGETLRRLDHVLRSALDHADQVRQRHRRDQAVVVGPTPLAKVSSRLRGSTETSS